MDCAGNLSGVWLSGTNKNIGKCWIWTTPVFSPVPHPSNWDFSHDKLYSLESCNGLCVDNLKYHAYGCVNLMAYLCKKPPSQDTINLPPLQDLKDLAPC